MQKRKLTVRFSATRKFADADYRMKLAIRHAIAATLRHEKFPYDAEVSVTLCDNAYIRCLNKKFRAKDTHTDVLSFPIYENGELDAAECIGGALLGDVVISLERAREQAKEIGHSTLEEIAFLAVHSTLHLLGYDHERSSEDDELQCRVQKEIMKTVKF